MLAWLGGFGLGAHAGGPAVVWGRGVGEEFGGWGFDGGAGEEGEGGEEEAGEAVACRDGGRFEDRCGGPGVWCAGAGGGGGGGVKAGLGEAAGDMCAAGEVGEESGYDAEEEEGAEGK